MTKLTGAAIAAEGLTGWTYLLDRLRTSIDTSSYAQGLSLVAAIGAVAEEANHHPGLDLRVGRLDVSLLSHDVRAVTERDVRLARKINSIAAEHGVRTDARSSSWFELALDTPDHGEISPFWAAVLDSPVTGADAGGEEVRDQRDVLPTVWFQDSGSDEPRQHWHLDLWVDPEQVQPRIDAALAAGGRLVSDAEAPAFWVLSDAQGNNICLCTWQSRD